MSTDNQKKSKVKTPFIIWTFRRTGGTNFGDALFNRSSFDGVQHEPFNADRVFGEVTKAWLSKQDKGALYAALTKICGRKVLMKHCIEVVPSALNRALAEISTQAGYRHLFLYRRRPLDRLMSLHFAKLSGVWGKDQASQSLICDEIFKEKLPVDELVSHETTCRREMRSAYKQLCELGAKPLVVTFEDLYESNDMAFVRSQVQAILGALGLSQGEAEDNAFLDQVLTRGEQGTRDKYRRFDDYGKLAKALDGLGGFVLQRVPGVSTVYPINLPTGVLKCEVWNPQPDVQVGRITVAGVVVLAQDAPSDCRLLIQDSGGFRDVCWDLASPRMETEFPGNSKATHSRFVSVGVSLSNAHPAKLFIERTDGTRELLVEIVASDLFAKNEPIK